MSATHSGRGASILLASLFLIVLAPAASAGDGNPMISVFKSTLYGGAAGLVLGLAVELVDSSADGDAARWGFVAGTFFGFGYGIYHASKDSSSDRALLERGEDGWALALPRPELVMHVPARARDSRQRTLEIRAPLALVRF